MRRNTPAGGVGLITVFTVLLVLCLSVISMLALSSARADARLSEANADFAAAYYRADLMAHRLYEDFAASEEAELERELTVTDSQSLRIHLTRQDGQVKILAWNTVNTRDEENTGLQLWDGTLEGLEG
ncbi:MAG: hypothetical protein ACOX81_03435 [Candidatus Heteroscillospira sp.]|jgi:hypothetical protein